MKLHTWVAPISSSRQIPINLTNVSLPHIKCIKEFGGNIRQLSSYFLCTTVAVSSYLRIKSKMKIISYKTQYIPTKNNRCYLCYLTKFTIDNIFEADNVLLKNSFTLHSAVKMQRKMYLLYVDSAVSIESWRRSSSLEYNKLHCWIMIRKNVSNL